MTTAAEALVVSDRKVFRGPNPIAPDSIVACRLRADSSIGPLLPAAVERLVDAFPRLMSDIPPLSAQREEPALEAGRLVACLARALLNDTRGFVREAGAASRAGSEATVWVGFHDPRVTTAAVSAACEALCGALSADAFPSDQLARRLGELQNICKSRHPDFQARILMLAAAERGIPILLVSAEARLWQYGWGARARTFFETASNADGFVGSLVSNSKTISKAFMQSLGMPTPRSVQVTVAADLPAAADSIGWPCVVKPLDLDGGRGVTAGVTSLAELESAFARARGFTNRPVMVEAFVPGIDHRLTVIDGSLVATTRREASAVTGDGVRTVRQLLDELNLGRSSNIVASRYHYPIAVDAILVEHLARQGLGPDAVPEVGRRVTLRSNANLSTGGVCVNVEDTHPQVRAMAETLAAALELNAIGLDYITPDISQPPAAAGGAFIEFNATPSLGTMVAGGMAEFEAGSLLLGRLPGRIPLLLILAEDAAKPELAHDLASMAAETPGLAWVSGTAGGLHRLPLDLSQLDPPDRVAALLKNRQARAAIVAWSPEDLKRFGAPVDRADVGVIQSGLELDRPWRRVLAAMCGRLVAAQAAGGTLATIRSLFGDLMRGADAPHRHPPD